MNPNFLLIFVCLFTGILLRKTGKLPDTSGQVLNAIVIRVSVPATVLIQIPAFLRSSNLSTDLFLPIAMPWILLTIAFFFFSWIGRLLDWEKEKTGAIILLAGLGNTSFVGFPILDALTGAEGLRIGVIIDQPGSFLCVSTLGLVVASMHSSRGKNLDFRAILKNVVTFPPLVSLVLAILWHFSGISFPPEVLTMMERLSLTLVPLALLAIGFQLKWSTPALKEKWKSIAGGLLFKLAFAPILFIIIYVFLLQSRSLVALVTILESAMGPMITAAVVSLEYELDNDITNLMVGIGVPLSILTVYFWHAALTAWFF